MERYLDVFKRNEIDYETFMELNDEHLTKLKIPYGPGLKIKKEIRRLNADATSEGLKFSYMIPPIFYMNMSIYIYIYNSHYYLMCYVLH